MDTLRTILDVVLRVVAFASIPCVIAAAVAQVRMLGRERLFERHSHVVGMVVSAGFLVLYTLVLRVTPVHWLSWPLLAGGAMAGALIGRMMFMDLRGPTVVTATAWWTVIAWAAAFSITQGMVVFAGTELVAIGLSTIFFSTGLTLGQDGILIFRETQLARLPAAAPWAPPSAAVATAAEPGTPAPAMPAYCPRCGLAVAPGQRFCMHCGQQVA